MLLNTAVEPLDTVVVNRESVAVLLARKSIFIPLADHAAPSLLMVMVAVFCVAVAVIVEVAPTFTVVLAAFTLAITGLPLVAAHDPGKL